MQNLAGKKPAIGGIRNKRKPISFFLGNGNEVKDKG